MSSEGSNTGNLKSQCSQHSTLPQTIRGKHVPAFQCLQRGGWHINVSPPSDKALNSPWRGSGSWQGTGTELCPLSPSHSQPPAIQSCCFLQGFLAVLREIWCWGTRWAVVVAVGVSMCVCACKPRHGDDFLHRDLHLPKQAAFPASASSDLLECSK